MKLTAFTDYSLRVLIFLAAQPGRRSTIAEIAAAFEVSEHHLTKVVHFLGKNGFIVTVRGKGGGLALARPPQSLYIGDLVRQTEGHDAPAECFEPSGRCRIARICRLRGVLAEAVDAFYEVLDRYTLDDLVGNRQALARVLFIDKASAPRAAP
jgi:Rrf2 family nitric oxide-sensitive transcriptional repressor